VRWKWRWPKPGESRDFEIRKPVTNAWDEITVRRKRHMVKTLRREDCLAVQFENRQLADAEWRLKIIEKFLACEATIYDTNHRTK
jgi:hypothetical protein